ncbi:MAG: AAA domain-containing protein [Clostridium sp.]|uniref:AAA domain-containing protein n=1 Tax=Clostridium sp. TaxID=1506 RepID=UPI002A760E60|nr:AAA domain-containing protein [Clostridium sp.]MDY2632202.1 AAA domain-containing protein [Clostridium sp.]MDY4252494.1 AAA domain-containing protein [Clostridium sp.]
MNEILEKYKDRLINLNGRNRALVTKKLPKKRAFDIYNITTINKDICNEVKKYIISNNENKLKLLPDYTSFYNEKRREIQKSIKEELIKEIEDIENLEIENDEKEAKLKVIREKLNEKEEHLLNELANTKNIIMSYLVSLKSLDKEINDVYKETGRYELYIGYPFIEGKLKDDTFIKSPLFLFPIRFNKKGDAFDIENISESNIFLNKVLLLAISKFNGVNLDNIETEYDKLDENFIEDILKKLEDEKVYIDYKDSEIEKFIEYTNTTLPKYDLGYLKVVSNMIIGQFSIANSIYNDYDELLKSDIDIDILERLLNTNYEGDRLSEEDSKLVFKERDINLISKLDYSQESAVNMVNKSNNLVIYGPPGTGKSETIVNIIGDALSKDKRVLMVSQKKAALDVIYNRLGLLNKKAILIHDINSDKKKFYSIVANSLETVEISNENFENYILNNSNYIDNKILDLEKIADVLYSKREFGLSLQEMYEETEHITSKEDPRYEEYLRFRKKNDFNNETYFNLKENISQINDDTIQSFITYTKLNGKNEFIDDIDVKMNFIDKEDLADNLQGINISLKTIIEKYTEDMDLYKKIMNEYKLNDYYLNDKKVEDIAVNINNSKNGHLLNKLNDNRWWSISYWINYSKNKKIEIENNNKFEANKEALINEVKTITKDINNLFKDMEIIKTSLNEKVYDLFIKRLLNGNDLNSYVNEIKEALDLSEKYKNDLILIKNLNDLKLRILNYSLSEDINLMKERINNLLEFITLNHILTLEKDSSVSEALKLLTSFEENISLINKEMESKRQNVRKLILSKWDGKILAINNISGFKEFKRQANKKRALWPIRKYFETYSNMILDVFPCFLLSPETVSEVLPLTKGLFDIVIFDEASQMYIESAIPSIFRGKQVVVAGDDKQLRPNGLFKNRYVDEEDEDLEEESSAALEEESLLDLAKVNYDSVYLTYHYRSRYLELINFSNYAFYGGRLKIAPNLNTSHDYKAIERIIVDGKWENKSNEEEAKKIAELVQSILKNRKNNETIGIITFNINQKSCIEKMLDDKAQYDEEFRELYTKEIDRIENDEDVSLFVKNIENVQGDERDIIIFSIAYAKNEKGRVSVNFGSLSQDGGENRLNVAISRAKQKIYVVTSIEPEELNVDSSKNKGPKLFKKYLQYVRAVSNGNTTESEAILNTVLDTDIIYDDSKSFDSDFEAEVYAALVEKGYNVHKQVGVSGYRIDLAIYDERKSQYILGIECDGATFHSSKSARERDIYRQRYLESRGWKITRIWSKNWWDNPKKEIEKIEKIITEIV